MELQTLLRILRKDIEEKSSLVSLAEAEHHDASIVKMELEIAIENFSSFFNALPMLM